MLIINKFIHTALARNSLDQDVDMEPGESSKATAPKILVPSSASNLDEGLKPADSEADNPEPLGAPKASVSSDPSSAKHGADQNRIPGGFKASRAATCTQASSGHDRGGNHVSNQMPRTGRAHSFRRLSSLAT